MSKETLVKLDYELVCTPRLGLYLKLLQFVCCVELIVFL